MKKLQVRMFDKENDFKILVNWAIAIKQVVPHPTALPGVGSMVVDEDGKKYGVGFLYLSTDTPVSVLEWVYFNPECSPKEKVATFKVILNVLEDIANKEGHPVMFAGSASPGLTRIMEKAGWTKTITGMDHLIKLIK